MILDFVWCDLCRCLVLGFSSLMAAFLRERLARFSFVSIKYTKSELVMFHVFNVFSCWIWEEARTQLVGEVGESLSGFLDVGLLVLFCFVSLLFCAFKLM